MITLTRAKERRLDRRCKLEVWQTFHSNGRANTGADGFGALELLNEERLPPGSGVSRPPHRDAEIVTCVREGSLAFEDSTGRSGVLCAGEFQCMIAGRGIRHSETNASRTECAQVFQIWLRPSEAELAASRDQKRFSTAERRGVLRIIASNDGRKGSLRIHQDALMYSAMLFPGQHVVHELLKGRSAWLHIVQGEASLDHTVLTTGDGAGVTSERSISLTAREETEILLFDLREQRPTFTEEGAVP